MKRLLLLSALMMALIAGCKPPNTKPSEQNAVNTDTTAKTEAAYTGPRHYIMKSGIIHAQLTGVTTGTETLYFDDYGMKEAKFTEVTNKVKGKDQKQHALSIIDGETQYTIDLTKKTGTKMKNPFFSQAFVNIDDDSLLALSEKMMIKDGGKKIGTETVAGKECDVWEIKEMSMKVWVWNAFPLKIEIASNGKKSYSIVTSIQENVPVPPEKFAVPEGITIEEASTADAAKAK